MISIVITTYERDPKILFRAINSVLSQTYNDIELIIVDDSSTAFIMRSEIKKQVALLKNDRIIYIQHEKSMGACVARNTGLNIAKGEYIGFLDDDDEWLPDKLQSQLNVFLENSEKLGLVYSQFYYCYENGSIFLPNKLFKKFQKGKIYDTLILDNYIGSTSFPLIRTKYLREIGGFDQYMMSCQDYDVWLRLSQKYYVAYVERPLVKYHIHSGESIGKNSEKRIRGQERLYSKNVEYLNVNRKAAHARLAVILPMYAQNNENMNAARGLLKLIKLNPLAIMSNFKILMQVIKYAIKYN